MKKTRNLTILLSAVIMMVSLICGTALAKRPTPPPVCGGLTGTWHGEESGDMIWLAIHTSDSLDPTKGEMLMNWIWISPNLIGPDVSLTPGHGVWQLNSDGTSNYTWYAYAIGTDGSPLYTVRVSGVALFNPEDPDDCNTVFIYYEFAYFNSVVPVGELNTAIPDGSITGGAVETRVPMVVTPLPEQ
ncbi:MAG: hypothetical protein HY788_16935 [Deltaproteobacteria bacterium]|nr:hypothetical protein [Deltaproteobacteria bacterium]